MSVTMERLGVTALAILMIVVFVGLLRFLDPAAQLVREVKDADAPWEIDGLHRAALLVRKHKRDQAVTPALIDLLGDDNKLVRMRAAQALGEINADRALAVTALLKVLADPYAGARHKAVIGLAKVRPIQERVVHALIGMRRDEEPHVRYEVIRALSDLGPGAEAAIPMLIDALGDKSVINNAMKALGNIGPKAKKATPFLLKISREAEDYDRRCAAEALWQIEGDPDLAVPILIELLKSKSLLSRRDAARTLQMIGRPARAAIPALIEAIEYQPKETKPDTNQKDQQGSATRPMTEAEFYPQIREAAVDALKSIKGG